MTSARFSATGEIEVFLCEDIDVIGVQEQLDVHRGDRPRLKIVGDAETLDDAKDRLFDLERFPDLVLVDDRLKRGADALPRRSAVELAAYIWERRRSQGLETKTRCVLWTASEDPLLFWTFRVCGGRHVVSKSLTFWNERTERLYAAVLHDQEWWPDPPRVHLQPSLREVIRYFDEGMPRAQIAERLGIDVATITSRAGELRRVLVEQHEDEQLPVGEVALARIAREAGWVWVPPQDDHLLPSAPPLPLVLDPAMLKEN